MIFFEVLIFSIIHIKPATQSVCKEEPCINLCCPNGYVIKDDLTVMEKSNRCDTDLTPARTCQRHSGDDLKWDGNWWQNDEKVGVVKKESFFGSEFQCDHNRQLVSSNALFGPNEVRLDLTGNHQFRFGSERVAFNSSEFCLSFTSYAEHSPIYPEFVVCHGVEVEEAEQFTEIFYPVLIFMSSFFTLLTLIAYLAIEDLRCNLFGKLVIGFLINVCINFFFNGIHYYLDLQENKDYLNTKFCFFLGYITHHSFIGFFFWMNAMAVNITYKFSNLLTTHLDERHDKSFVYAVLYAQGVPLLITLTIGLMDNYGSCESILPNMGQYTCFVGSVHDPSQQFIETPNFIYFYLIVLIIVVSNTICFLITGYFLTINWSTVRRMQTSNRDDNLMTHVVLVAKLSVIMGVPWTLDVISAAIAHTQGHSNTIWKRLILDILNLLTGVLIFIILVCKKNILAKLRRKLAAGSTFSEIYELNSKS